MSFDNRLRRALARLDRAPGFLQDWLRSRVIGRTIPFVGTAGVEVRKIAEDEVVAHVPNERKAQNHIGTVHAAAMALVAETATGLVVGMNVHDDAVPVIKSMHVDYLRRAQGDLTAVARLEKVTITRLQTEERGEVRVPVTVSDMEGRQPVACEMVWAWTPKRRPGG